MFLNNISEPEQDCALQCLNVLSYQHGRTRFWTAAGFKKLYYINHVLVICLHSFYVWFCFVMSSWTLIKEYQNHHMLTCLPKLEHIWHETLADLSERCTLVQVLPLCKCFCCLHMHVCSHIKSLHGLWFLRPWAFQSQWSWGRKYLN